MNEALLQFIWQNNLYNAGSLTTTDGEPVVVLHAGRLNRDSGPDFTGTQVRIGATILVGNTELHVKTSDWYKHKHETDDAYKNLVLHVVYEKDATAVTGIPELVLKDHISDDTIARYTSLVKNTNKLPCGTRHAEVKALTKEGWLSRLVAERWEQKLCEWDAMLTQTTDDWRNLLYWRLAANFGFKTNSTPFLLLAQSLPLNIVARHKDNMMQLEALLFGQAGMLHADFSEDYPRTLQREYDYLRKKYSLKPIKQELWKFMRMRPVNFPTVRIAQFASLLHQSVHLFSQVIERHTVKELTPLLQVAATEYWNTHYRFDHEHGAGAAKVLGRTSAENIIINTVAPIQFLYAARHGDARLQERALHLLEAVPAEDNSIIEILKMNGWVPVNASQTQGMLQLYNSYCSSKKCLDCAIGHTLMRR
jgi:hypothetical protein